MCAVMRCDALCVAVCAACAPFVAEPTQGVRTVCVTCVLRGRVSQAMIPDAEAVYVLRKEHRLEEQHRLWEVRPAM
eukprot:5660527-Prymnesium_polylepis.1